jgi:hypothetical protein
MSAPDDEIKDQIENVLGGRSEAELRKLAAEIIDNVVFTDRHIRKEDRDMFEMIFLPVALGDSRVRSTLQSSGMIYEYWEKALPRSINGYPIFMGFDSVLKKDMPALEHYIKEYREMKAKYFAAPIPPQIPVPGST